MNDERFSAMLRADAEAGVLDGDRVGATTPDLAGAVQELLDLKDQIELLDSDLKGLRQRYDDVRKRQLPELMQAAGLVGPNGKGSFTHTSGAKVHLRGEVYAHVPKDSELAFFDWLRAEGHGALIRETVNSNTLKAFVRERLESDQPLPPQVTHHLETVAVVTNPKKRGES